MTFNTLIRITAEGSLAALNPKTIIYRGMDSFKLTTYVGAVSFWITPPRVSATMHS